MLKRTVSVFLMLVLLLALACPLTAMAESQAPSRTINVVYDDSGSMYRTDGSQVDTWAQAKYSMEVFAALLGENDIMNVYYMSDYESGTSSAPRLILKGSDGTSANVAKIHNQTTRAGNTPFNSVKKALADLKGATSDEKWLVILTDGEFEDGRLPKSEIDSFLASKSQDIKVMFLSMGPNAAGITDKPDQNIYYIQAKSSKEILNNITEICTRIFNTNKLEVNVSSKNFTFDVPMGELTVFAQGANVNINGIKREDGTLIQSSSTPVEVKYSDCDATNYNNPPVKDLLGEIATFKDDFSVGQYSLDVSGAETIEIYYKPNVEVAAYLTDERGQIVSDLSNLAAGNYTISFGFVKTGTKEKVADSKLLGDVSYSALVTNNGKTHEKLYSDGDKIALEEGPLTIDVTARYLDYNSVSTNLSYDIYKDKTITFTVVDSPSYVVTSDGFEKDARIKVVSQIDGKDFTEEQWSSLEAPILQMVDEKRDFKIELSTLEKSDEVGVFYFNPKLPNGKPSTGTYQDIQYTLDYRQQFGSETWSGSTEGSIIISDSRSWWERNWDLFVKLVILAAILFVLIGYLPFIKHYLPKSLKKKPYIKCIPSEPGEKRKDRNGVINKNLVSTLIPYIPQTGTIKYVPKGVTGCPAMAVRAIKHRRMTLTNVKAFAGKDYITFDGEAIKKDVKKFETGAGVSIRVKRGEWTYICSPNQSN